MRYLLDTNICMYLMKRQPSSVARRFAECYQGDIAISAITLAELEYGVEADTGHRQQNEAALAAMLEDIRVVPFDQAAARAYGQVRLAARERTRDARDKLIAAHALSLGLTLVTNNPVDFAVYPGLVVENWVE
jgi:tRNA(fMet)-specific endonuclease VapC